MCNKMAISAYILKIVENDPFLRFQMRTKENFKSSPIFFTNKQHVKIKLMQNETNLWSNFFVKTKYWSNFDLNFDLNFHIFDHN